MHCSVFANFPIISDILVLLESLVTTTSYPPTLAMYNSFSVRNLLFYSRNTRKTIDRANTTNSLGQTSNGALETVQLLRVVNIDHRKLKTNRRKHKTNAIKTGGVVELSIQLIGLVVTYTRFSCYSFSVARFLNTQFIYFYISEYIDLIYRM